jgi:hypothetical protein
LGLVDEARDLVFFRLDRLLLIATIFGHRRRERQKRDR